MRSTMTEEKARLAKYLVFVKKVFQHEAAARLGVNQGRICEVVNGKRFTHVTTPTAEQVPPDIR